MEAIGDALEVKAAGGPEQAENSQQQAEIADAVHNEGLLGRMGRPITVVPEADQQVGTHAHQLPKDVDLEKVRADDQPQHRTAE